MKVLFGFSLLFLAGGLVFAQAPDVEVMRDRGGPLREMIDAANVHREAGKLLSLECVASQMERDSFDGTGLPEPLDKALTDREIWARSKAAHVRVGWHYLCQRCDHWHQSLAGGFFVSTNGLVASNHHVIDPGRKNYREGYLIVATEQGEVFPVLEVMASDKNTDSAILRVAVDRPVVALPLREDVYPGDAAWCYSDPLRRVGYFSKGMVNRFYYTKGNEDSEIVRMEVSTAWAPGSSGSAVVDQYGNAIGMVSEVTAGNTGGGRVVRRPGAGDDEETISMPDNTVIVFRSAVRASDVRALCGLASEAGE